jgi:hypothetical protein
VTKNCAAPYRKTTLVTSAERPVRLITSAIAAKMPPVMSTRRANMPPKKSLAWRGFTATSLRMYCS